MGSSESSFNGSEFKSALRQAKARINIHRGHRVNAITNKKKDIKGHLESGNEVMALIHVISSFNS